MVKIRKHIYSEKDLFFINLKKVGISKEEQKILYDLVINLDERTDNQKNRFLLYYNLAPNQNEEYNFTRLAKKYGCSCNAVISSISRVRSNLANLKKKEQEIFMQLVKNNVKEGELEKWKQ